MTIIECGCDTPFGTVWLLLLLCTAVSTMGTNCSAIQSNENATPFDELNGALVGVGGVRDK